MTRQFRVVTHKNWLAKQFLDALPYHNVVQDFGFDIDPKTAKGKLWWAPGAWVASALATGVELPLLSCGPYWLDTVPYKFTQRTVTTLDMKTAREGTWWLYYDKLFVKLPEAKHDGFPARTHIVNKFWSTTLGQYHLPDSTLVQIQEPVDFVAEVRCWVVNGEVVTHSWYRLYEQIWGSEEWQPPADDHPQTQAALKFACEVASKVDGPPGYVLDVGRQARNEEWIVVEANAAWSSGPYDGDPVAIFDCIEAAHDFDGVHRQWAWSKHNNPIFGTVRPLEVVRRG